MSRTASTRYDVQSAPFVTGRVATLPVEAVVALLESERPLEAARELFATNAFARAAVAVASPSLAAAIDEWVAGRPLRNPKTPVSALAYAVRMASRCTPFGLFAGVGMVETGEGGELALAAGAFATRTRPDMGLIGELCAEIEAGPDRERVRFVTNACAFEAGERLYVTNVALANRATGAAPVEQRDVSLRHTQAVRFVREYCAGGAEYGDVVRALCARFGAREEESRRLFDTLVRAGVAISELHVSPLGEPVEALLERFDAIGAAPASRLRAALASAAAIDAVPLYEQTAQSRLRVAGEFAALAETAAADAVQVDARVAFAGSLPAPILEDAAILAGLATRAGRVFRMDEYRRRFVERYEGETRLVPLLELVDNDRGLGTPGEATFHECGGEARAAEVLHLFAEAARCGLRGVDLRGGLLDRVFPAHGEGRAPRAVEVGFAVAARDGAAIERGEYRVVSTMLLDRAAKSTARFCHVLGEPATEALRSIVRRAVPRDELVVEFTYAPVASRSYNVCIRPRFHDYEMPAGLGVPPGFGTLSPSDCWVGIEDGTFYLWSASLGRRVTACESHALVTALGAPNLCRFLALAFCDGLRVPEFHLGPAESLPYLPRVTYGRLVLRPRRWLVPANETGGMRERCDMPRYVHLCRGDNRLLLDLNAPSARLLLDEYAAGERTLHVEEAIPAPGEMWVRAEDGAHAVEFVAQAVAAEVPAAPPPRAAAVVARRTRYGPGSAWTYAKLYVGRQAADAFLVSHAVPFVREQVERGAVDRWFFLRYGDPQHHLRLRLHAAGQDTSVRDALLARAETWLSQEQIGRYALDTYDPEYERYGEGASLQAVERFFTLDSEACAAALAEGIAATDWRVEAAAASFDALLGASEPATRAMLDAFAALPRQTMRASDREALRRVAAALGRGGGAPLEAALGQPPNASRLAAFVHVHCNRFGLYGDEEARVAMLLRALALARASRSRQPVARD